VVVVNRSPVSSNRTPAARVVSKAVRGRTSRIQIGEVASKVVRADRTNDKKFERSRAIPRPSGRGIFVRRLGVSPGS
jgi:hypothetical protein